MNLSIKKLLPHVVAVAAFIIISSIYFSPLFDGYNLRQGDIAHFKGMSKELVDFREEYGEQSLWSTNMFSGMPSYQISVVYASNVLRYIDKGLQLGLPRPIAYLFMCMLGYYILFVCLKINPWVSGAFAIIAGLSSVHILYLGAGHMSKVRAISYMAPFIGGLIYAFRTNWLKGSAIAALFLGLHVLSNHLQMTYYLIFLTVFIVISETIRLILAQKTNQIVKIYGGLLVAALLAFLANSNNIISTYEYSKHTMRGKTELTISPKGEEGKKKNLAGLEKDYIVQYSLGQGEVLSLLVPNIKGGANQGAMTNIEEAMDVMDPSYQQMYGQFPNYWGEQNFTSGAFYFGALLAALFIIALFGSKDSIKWPLLAFTVLALLLSMKYGSLTESFIDNFPMFSKFRDTKMMLVGVTISFAVLGGLFIQELIENKIEEARAQFIYIGAGVCFILFAVLAFTPGSVMDFVSKQESEIINDMISKGGQQGQSLALVKNEIVKGRTTILKADALRSFGFALCAIVMVFLMFKKITNGVIVASVVGLIGVLDIWGVDKRYLHADDDNGLRRYYESELDNQYPNKFTFADKTILERELSARPELVKSIESKVKERKAEDENFKAEAQQEFYCGQLRLNSNYRVVPLGNPFNDARTAHYHKSIGGYHGMKLGKYQDLIDFLLVEEINSVRQGLSLGMSSDSVFKDAKVLNMLNTKYAIVQDGAPALQNRHAFGPAWFVQDTKMLKNADEIMMEMTYGEFDPSIEALVHEKYQDKLNGVSNDHLGFDETIEMTSFKSNEISYKTSSKANRLAVFSEIYFEDGWQAYLDGQEVDHLEVNYLLRGVNVPAGEHEVKFVFAPSRFSTLNMVSMIFSVLIVLAFAYLMCVWKDNEATVSVEE